MIYVLTWSFYVIINLTHAGGEVTVLILYYRSSGRVHHVLYGPKWGTYQQKVLDARNRKYVGILLRT